MLSSLHSWSSLMSQLVENLPTMQETCVQFLGWEDHLEDEMATHSSILAWEILWTKELGWLQFKVLWIVKHDWATEAATFLDYFSFQGLKYISSLYLICLVLKDFCYYSCLSLFIYDMTFSLTAFNFLFSIGFNPFDYDIHWCNILDVFSAY